MLPNIDIDVAALRVHRIIFASAVAGERQEARFSGKIAIADRRAQVRLDAATIGADAKGDTLKLLPDAVPARNRLAMTPDRDRPQGDVLAAMGGFNEPVTAKTGRRGDRATWDGRMTESARAQ